MSDRSRILILESDDELRELISLQLGSLCDELKCAKDLNEALCQLKGSYFDLLIMNGQLPEISRKTVIEDIRKLKSKQTLSLLMLTKPLNEEEQNEAFFLGVDEILFKPFERVDLTSKVKALIRRVRPASQLHLGVECQNQPRLRVGEVELDLKSFDVYCDSERIHLTPSEFKLLHALAMNRGKILTRDDLINLVQGEGIAVIDRAVDTHIFGLRKKLGEHAKAIETVRGEGYRVNAVI